MKFTIERTFLILGILMCGLASPQNISAESVTQTYFVAAEEILWDYAPTGKQQVMGRDFNDAENVFMANTSNTIGRVYKKARFIEYTDDTFTTPKSIPEEWKHLGYLGPVIRARLGDTIKVVFKNKLNFPASMHPHGVFYEKHSEGAPYNDGTGPEDKKGDMVKTGEVYTYTWEVPESAGPGPNDPSSIIWMYHSHVNSPRATNTGLVGPIIISKGNTGRPLDVDREFVTLFTVTDENESFFLDENIETYTNGNVDKDDDDFIESNLMHGINGYVYGNLPNMEMHNGDRVRWYLIGLGTEVDLHTPHWHGHTVLHNGNRTDVMELMPASLKTVDMRIDNEGKWLYHCHVNDHIKAGMLSTYTVLPKNDDESSTP